MGSVRGIVVSAWRRIVDPVRAEVTAGAPRGKAAKPRGWRRSDGSIGDAFAAGSRQALGRSATRLAAP